MPEPDNRVVSPNGARKSAAQTASRAIWVAIGFTAAAVLVGVIAFAGRLTPLSGGYSVGTVAGWATGIAAGVSALIGLIIAAGSHVGTLG